MFSNALENNGGILTTPTFPLEWAGAWPLSTHLACRWDTEPFSGPPVSAPVRLRRASPVSGDVPAMATHVFCGWACANAYLRSIHSPLHPSSIWAFARREFGYQGPLGSIRPAGSIDLLAKFGGPLTTHQYRKTFADTMVSVTKLPGGLAPSSLSFALQDAHEQRVAARHALAEPLSAVGNRRRAAVAAAPVAAPAPKRQKLKPTTMEAFLAGGIAKRKGG